MKPLADSRSVAGAARRTCAGLLGLLLSTLLAPAAAPLRWHWSNPRPHGGNVVDMTYSPSLFLGVQVAERGQIYTSDNLDLWLPRESGTTNALRAVTFFGARLLITGENGCVLYADDVNHFQAGTLLDGPTASWLEAVTASPTLAVAVGDYGSIYASNDGVSWKKQSVSFVTWLRGVAFGGGVFVAVGENGFVATSPNGTNWTSRDSGTLEDLNRVQFASGRFTAMGTGGTTLSSTNAGAAWFPESSGATNALQNTATAGMARLLVGDNEVRLFDGGRWSNELAKTNGPPAWNYLSCVGLPDFFLIAGRTGLQSEGYRTNGVPFFWLTPFNAVRNWLWDALYVTNAFFYVAVGDYGTVMTSDNGVDWNLESMPPAATNTTFLGVGGTTNLLLAVGDAGAVYYSPPVTYVLTNDGSGTVVTQAVDSLGVIWRPVSLRPTTNDLQGVTVTSNGLYVLSGDHGTVLTSPTGTNLWSRRTTPVTSLLSSVVAWPGGLVATGDDGAIITSTNGINWTRRGVGLTTNWLYRVRYWNGLLIAVGQNGSVFTSTNGINWTNRATGTTKWLTDAACVSNTWYVVGFSGTVLSSTNLLNWTHQGALTQKHLQSAATDAQQLIAVGVEGIILRSQVVPDLTPITILNYDRALGSNAAYNVFLFGGKADQRFTVDRTPSLSTTNWSTGPRLEFFDSSGVLYYLETFGTNQPLEEYYRAVLAP